MIYTKNFLISQRLKTRMLTVIFTNKHKTKTKSHVIPTSIPVDALVRNSEPDLNSKDDNVPFKILKSPKKDE